jgi:hypothetical protein
MLSLTSVVRVCRHSARSIPIRTHEWKVTAFRRRFGPVVLEISVAAGQHRCSARQNCNDCGQLGCSLCLNDQHQRRPHSQRPEHWPGSVTAPNGGYRVDRRLIQCRRRQVSAAQCCDLKRCWAGDLPFPGWRFSNRTSGGNLSKNTLARSKRVHPRAGAWLSRCIPKRRGPD